MPNMALDKLLFLPNNFFTSIHEWDHLFKTHITFFDELTFLKGSFIQYVRKIFRKTVISYPLIHTRTGAFQGVGNVSFRKILPSH